jgi:hypothetical protein
MKNRFCKFGIPTLAASLVGLILLLDAMAACPALHEMIHKDADEADHHCAVTMFAQGKVDSATSETVIPEPTTLIETPRYFTFSIFSPAIENLPQGRAPPTVISPQA